MKGETTRWELGGEGVIVSRVLAWALYRPHPISRLFPDPKAIDFMLVVTWKRKHGRISASMRCVYSLSTLFGRHPCLPAAPPAPPSLFYLFFSPCGCLCASSVFCLRSSNRAVIGRWILPSTGRLVCYGGNKKNLDRR